VGEAFSQASLAQPHPSQSAKEDSMAEKKVSKTWQNCKYKLRKRTRHNGDRQWILYYKRQSKSTGKFGHWEKWAIKDIVPQWIFNRAIARTHHGFKHLKGQQKDYEILLPYISDGLLAAGKEQGFSAALNSKSDHYGNAVSWYCHGKLLAVILISDMTDKLSCFDNRKIAQELRDATTKSGARFRRMEEKCEAPFRLAYVVRKGGFCRLVIGKLGWLKKEHHE
jgi:hypothetical protein